MAWKISSGLIHHIPLISYLSKFKRLMILSTGIAKFDEVAQQLKLLEQKEIKKLLFCNARLTIQSKMKISI